MKEEIKKTRRTFKYDEVADLNYTSLIELRRLLLSEDNPAVRYIDKVFYERLSFVLGKVKGRGMRGRTKIKTRKRRKIKNGQY